MRRGEGSMITRSVKVLAVLLALWLLMTFAGPARAVVLTGGEYEVIVAIDPEMAHDAAMIGNIKTMMTEASNYLWTSLKEQGIFGKVIILVPDSWPDDPTYLPSAGETVAGADIFVGKNVGCGACASAGRIQIDDGSMNGKTIVHEWGHYRFSLGDEYCDYIWKANAAGVYAWYQVYKTAAGWNRCTALQDIERSCEERGPGAACNITKNDVNGATASIMHRQANAGIINWCDAGTDAKTKHNADVNNHQNRIHAKKSTWEVIDAHADGFKFTGGTKIAYKAPVFEVKKAKVPNVVLVLDVSGSMSGARIANSAQAAKNFVDRAELGTYIGVVSFSYSASLLLPLTKVTFPTPADQAAVDNRPTIKAAIPTTAPGPSTSIGSGMIAATTELTGATATTNGLAKVMLLLTDGQQNEAPAPADAMPGVLANNIKVYSVGLGAASDAVLQDIAAQTDGVYYNVPDNDAQALSDAFTSIGNNVAVLPKNTLSSQSLTVTMGGGTGKLLTLIDDTVGENTIFSFLINGVNATDTVITLTQPNNTVLDNTYAGYSQDNVSQIITFEIAGTAASGTWTADISNNNATTNADVAMEVTSGGTSGTAPITLTAKLNATAVTYPSLVQIEASLISSDAIINANVWADITDPAGTVVTVQLLDNGQGADLFQLDGIYSGYFTQYTADGRYSVKVYANNAANTAEKGAQFNDSSATQSDIDQDIWAAEGNWIFEADHGMLDRAMTNPSGLLNFNFDRVISAGGFELNGFNVVDQIPPGKITTLSVVSHTTTSVVLTWIATGDNADTGTATSYDLRYSTSPINTDTEFNGAKMVAGVGNPKTAGQTETYTLGSLATQTYYFAIKAIDAVGNASPLSNVYKAVLVTPDPPAPGGDSGGGGCFINSSQH